MNKTVTCLLTRRSVRSFQDKAVEEAMVNEIILCGRYAPSGGGDQAAVIAKMDDTVRNNLARINADVWGKEKDPFWGAPVVLAVLADKRVRSHVEDGAAAMENMLIAAESLGLHSCWVCRAEETFDTDYGKKLLEEAGLDPQNYIGIGFCALGYAEQTGDAAPRSGPLFYTLKEIE